MRFEPDSTTVVTTPEPGPLSKMRWSSVLAGAVAFLSVALLLWGLAFAIVSLVAHPTPASTRGGALVLWISAMATTIIGAVVGGWLAGRLIAGAPPSLAAAHGFVTWGVALLVAFGFQMFALRGLVTAAVSEASEAAVMNAQPGTPPDAAADQMSWKVARDYLTAGGWSWFGTWLVAGVAAAAAGAAGTRILAKTIREPSIPVDETRRRPLTPTTVP